MFLNVEIIQKVYICCLAVGVIVPVFQLLLAGMGNFMDMEMDTGTFESPFPINLMTLACFTLLFGAAGRLSLNSLGIGRSLFVAVLCGVAGAWLLGRYVILPLKRNLSPAHKIEDLRWKVGVVKLEIRSDFIGTILIQSTVGNLITYSARAMEGVEKIAVGEQVMVVEVDAKNRVCTVSPMNKQKEEHKNV